MTYKQLSLQCETIMYFTPPPKNIFMRIYVITSIPKEIFRIDAVVFVGTHTEVFIKPNVNPKLQI